MKLFGKEKTRQKWKRGLRALLTAVPMTLLLGVGVSAAASADTDRGLTDDGIEGAIEAELLIDPGVRAEPIDVMVDDGVARLEGMVNSLLAKERAAMIAGLVRGVRSVVDDIEVAPVLSLTDESLRQNVERALLDDAATDSYEIEVAVDDGHATLTGEVDSWAEKRLAETVAKSVYGVRELDNELRVTASGNRTDNEIESEVEAALQWDARVDDHLIEVEVEDGVIALSGTVGSWAERFRAIDHGWVSGVTAVRADDLEIESWARDRFLRKTSPDVTDEQIEEAVELALAHDARVDETSVFVTADDGRVTLRGSVDQLLGKRAAEQDARNTMGALAVENRLRVSAEPIADSELTRHVIDTLRRDPWVERYEIAVSADDGRIYLDGVVDSRFEKARADDLAARVAGVEMVINRLDVDADRWPLIWDPFLDDSYSYGYDWWSYEPRKTLRSDVEIERSIESQLFWSPFVDADEVSVTVDDGVATLAGTVDSWSEWRAARHNAFEGGAVWVDNDLSVERDTGA